MLQKRDTKSHGVFTPLLFFLVSGTYVWQATRLVLGLPDHLIAANRACAALVICIIGHPTARVSEPDGL
jgi:hypothetical protein